MTTSRGSLDPSDWQTLRTAGHNMLDDMFDYLSTIGQRPVWQVPPIESIDAFTGSMPEEEGSLESAHATFLRHILPNSVGNAHPGFMGWVHGGGSPVGMLAEMLAAGLNANLGGRDHIPIAVEQQIVAWMRDLFGFPNSASGLFVTGSSIANFIGVLVARTSVVGANVRRTGLKSLQENLVAYASTDAHGCIGQALELSGLGSCNLRRIPVNDQHQMRLDILAETIAADRQAGYTPFCVVGSAGTVDVGAIDDLDGISIIAKREELWFHIDGACGALGMLSEHIARKLKGIELADSIALDFHKWGQVPYDAGFILVRDSQLQQETFASPAAYLRRETRGMAAGSPWPCDFGPDLSRSFKALKVWFTFQVYGRKRLGAVMDHTCDLAQYLAERITASNELELLAPVQLNIVCFRFRCHDANRVNSEIVVAIQESGLAAPSATTINGEFAIRAALFNHRTTRADVDRLVDTTLRLGRTICFAPPLFETSACKMIPSSHASNL